jgi:hypothetical protein
VLIVGLGARISAAEGDPHGALAEAARAVRIGVDMGCNEPVIGGLLDSAAGILAAAGELRAAELLLATATAVRGPLPRTVPEQEWADEARLRVAAGLTAADRSAARAEGAALTPESAARLLAELAEVHVPAKQNGLRAAGNSEPQGTGYS